MVEDSKYRTQRGGLVLLAGRFYYRVKWRMEEGIGAKWEQKGQSERRIEGGTVWREGFRSGSIGWLKKK